MYYILATKIPRISKDYKSWSRWKYHRYFSLQPALLLVVFIMTAKKIIENGTKFWNLTIVKEIKQHTKPNWESVRMFLCRCDCWNKKSITIYSLTSWHTKSCWCYRDRINSTHWMSKCRIYKTRENIQKRCNNKKQKEYKNYWWRGIRCEWESFEEFYKDMKQWYEKKLTIDRINNDWNYCKENCRRSTMKVQARNTRRNVLYNWKCISERAGILGVRVWLINNRINRWRDIEKAIFTSNK